MEISEDHKKLRELLEQNVDLSKQNNEILKKLYRHSIMGIWFRVIWYAVLIGMPFAVYFYLLEPYFEAFGANYELFRQGLGEIPGLKGIENLFPSTKR